MKVMETTAAIYLRKSTEDDGKSVAAQERQLRSKAEQLGIDTATLLFYLFRLEVHGLQQLRRTLRQSTPVDVITLRLSCWRRRHIVIDSCPTIRLIIDSVPTIRRSITHVEAVA